MKIKFYRTIKYIDKLINVYTKNENLFVWWQHMPQSDGRQKESEVARRPLLALILRKITPGAVVLSEIGLSVKNQFPKSTDDIETDSFDKIISMGCGVNCPNLRISQVEFRSPHGQEAGFYQRLEIKFSIIYRLMMIIHRRIEK